MYEKELRRFRRILSFARPFWKLFAFTTILSLLSTSVMMASPWLMKIFLDDVLINKKYEMFYIVLGGFVGLFAFNQVFGFIYDMASLKLNQAFDLHVKKYVFSHLLNLHVGYFKSNKVGDLMSRVSGDVTTFMALLTLVFNTVFVRLFQTVAVLVISLSLSVQATALTLAVFPIYYFSERYFVKRMKAVQSKAYKTSADIQSFLQETLGSVRAVKVFGQEEVASAQLAARLQSYNLIEMRKSLLTHVSSFIVSLIQYAPVFVVLSVGGYEVMIGLMTVGSLVALQTYISQLFSSLSVFFSFNRAVQMYMVPIERVFDILDTEPRIKNAKNPVPFRGVGKGIAIEKVGFCYEEGKEVLNDVDLRIGEGESIGVVGKIGAGKSTLANLLIRLYDPTAGRIVIDGTDLRRFELKSLREGMGVVSQESILFNMSIRENIAFSKPEAGMEEITNAARAAGIHDFISGLPQGYETIVGEKGAALSGGQKQMLSIARVLLRDPPFIVLDEPTSSIDPETEKSIRDSIQAISRAKTMVVIAHRLSTLQDVDRLVFLENGRVAEEGDFASLMKRKGRFYHFYNSQFATYENFLSRLMAEVKKARDHDRELYLGVIELGEKAEKAEGELEEVLSEGYFYGIPTHSLNTVQIALPSLERKEAEEYLTGLSGKLERSLGTRVRFSIISDIKKIEALIV